MLLKNGYTVLVCARPMFILRHQVAVFDCSVNLVAACDCNQIGTTRKTSTALLGKRITSLNRYIPLASFLPIIDRGDQAIVLCVLLVNDGH